MLLCKTRLHNVHTDESGEAVKAVKAVRADIERPDVSFRVCIPSSPATIQSRACEMLAYVTKRRTSMFSIECE